MIVLVSGASGLVGTALVQELRQEGHEVLRLVRRAPAAADEVRWDADSGVESAEQLEVDAVVHLAGESIAEGRWSDAKKRRILESRTKGTRALCESIARMKRRPSVLVSASAIGFYGDRGDEVLGEESASGSNFVADVCRQWEAATELAAQAGVRVVNLRIGVVLAGHGGALKKMLLPFLLGAGGKLGSGDQYMSWIGLDDVVGAIRHCLVTESLSGPVNATSPNPVTNVVYTKTLGRVLKRPTIAPMPGFAARLVFGQMADELLLASARVRPTRLEESGYAFRSAELEPCLRVALNRPS
jgi:uncharacterized protein (TIGR01777 family)